MAPIAMHRITLRRAGAIGVAALAMLISACMLMPGRFTSDLDIRKDGRFSFTYIGEIHLLALSKLANGQLGSDATFTAKPCYGDDLSSERPCTAAETAEQKREWEAARAERAARRKRDAESMKPLLGGIDPSNPAAAEELAQRLRRQAGWRRVVYKGDGLYEVDFAISGRLDHDFAFPTIERFPMANGFVQIAVRQDGTVRIDAPGFGPAMPGEPYAGLLQGAMMMGQSDSSKAPPPGFPVVDGRFTLRTDAEVLANNTDEGPQADTTGRRLNWLVNPRTVAAPMALLKF